MRTKAIAVTLWTLLVVTFSGCATKAPDVVVQKCMVEKPARELREECYTYKSDLEFMQCVARNYVRIEGDYTALEKAFEGCK